MRLAQAIFAGAICTAVATASAASGPSVDIPTRAKGAQRIVVATVTDVQASMSRSSYGDQVIVSRLLLQVEEILKGQAKPAFSVDVEGGTIGALTLRVSDMPSLHQGDRAVFFTNPGASGADVPHLRGLGILKLDAANRIEGESNVTLDDVRRIVEAVR
jgi:hypothetical protein